jgi:hypothetical protein
MIGFVILLLHVLVAPFKTQARLEAEIVLLRHQLSVLRQRVPSRPRLTAADRLLFVWLYRLFPSVLNALTIVQPETVIRWHRTGFRLYWRWKSRTRGGRPKIPGEIRRLIREMSLANRLWGAPRIHGELLKLGIEVAQSTVAKYMARSGRGRSQTWKTFLHNHAAGIGAMDFLVVPTVGFRLLFVLVILRHQRRRLISLSVTANPTAEWIARQITEAFPWDEAPDYIIRDRDGSYGQAVTKRLAAMGIRDHPTAARSPAGNASITSSSSARPTCAGSLQPTPAITTNSERICPWVRIRRAIGQSNGSASSLLSRSSADFIIIIAGYRADSSGRRNTLCVG